MELQTNGSMRSDVNFILLEPPPLTPPVRAAVIIDEPPTRQQTDIQAPDIILSDTYIRPETNYTKAVIQLDLQLQKECRQRNEKSGLQQFVVRDLRIVELAGDELEKNSERTTEPLDERYRALTYDPIFLPTRIHDSVTVCCWFVIGITAIFAVATLIVTALNFGDCKVGIIVPIGLLAFSVILLLLCLPCLHLFRKTINVGEHGYVRKSNICALLSATILVVALMLWLISAAIAYANAANWSDQNVLTVDSDNPLTTTTMDPQYYCTSNWYISLVFKIVFFGSAVFVVFVLFVAIICVGLWASGYWVPSTYGLNRAETHAQRWA